MNAAEFEDALRTLGVAQTFLADAFAPLVEGGRCPVCEADGVLTVERTGEVACASGCDADKVAGYIEATAKLQRRVTPQNDDPLDEINVHLAKHEKITGVTLGRLTGGNRYGTRGAQFIFAFDDGRRLELHGAREIYERTRLRDALGEQLGVTLNLTPADHRELAAKLVAIATPVANLDSPEDELRDWLQSFTGGGSYGRCRRIDEDDRTTLADFISSKESFTTTTGELYLRPGEFLKYVQRQLGAHVTRSDVQRRLSRLGFTRKQRAVRVGKDTHSARYWTAPLSVIEGSTTDDVPAVPLYREDCVHTSRGNTGNTGTPSNGGADPGEGSGNGAGADGNVPAVGVLG